MGHGEEAGPAASPTEPVGFWRRGLGSPVEKHWQYTQSRSRNTGDVATTDRWVKSTSLRPEHGKVQRREGRELEVTDRGRGG